MKAVIQRVQHASVTVDGIKIADIKHGILLLLGIAEQDSEEDCIWLSKKIANLRIFNDENDVMNTSLIDIKGEAIVVSQFTLQASTKKGHRPSYIKAAKSEIATPIYQAFVKQFEQDLGKKVQTGAFGADMKVELLNDGPITILIDTENKN
jgi:D-tyrosyl-tRNA(Tyr) deacylase